MKQRMLSSPPPVTDGEDGKQFEARGSAAIAAIAAIAEHRGFSSLRFVCSLKSD